MSKNAKVSGAKLMKILNCSKPYLYGLIDKRLITPFYFGGEDGNLCKPYYDLEEVYSALKPMADGGIKRKSQVKNTTNHEPA